jgi:hypothetical protein
MLPALVTLGLTVWLAAAPAKTQPCADEGTRYGVEHARTAVDAFLDPTADSALLTVLELRRLVAERPSEVTVRIHLVTTPGTLDPRAEAVRAWLASMSAHDRLVPALRVVRTDGTDRVYVRLSTKAARRDLARALDLPPELHERAAAERCHANRLAVGDAELRRRMQERGTTVFRLPVFGVSSVDTAASDQVFEDTATLERLRPQLGRERSRVQHARVRPKPPLPEARAVSERLRRPELEGARLGGVGLPHLFVLMARDEDDPNLFMLLPPVLEFRRDHPGLLTVQVVARGGSFGAQSLRHRLCAARRQGLVAAYVHHLASDPAIRHTDPAVQDLLETLDKVPIEACEDDVDPAELGLPDGGWLDGIPRTRSELEGIEATLDLLETTARPLSPLLGPHTEEL